MQLSAYGRESRKAECWGTKPRDTERWKSSNNIFHNSQKHKPTLGDNSLVSFSVSQAFNCTLTFTACGICVLALVDSMPFATAYLHRKRTVWCHFFLYSLIYIHAKGTRALRMVYADCVHFMCIYICSTCFVLCADQFFSGFGLYWRLIRLKPILC